MRGIPVTLLFAVALVASGSCLAQEAAATPASPQAEADASTAEVAASTTEPPRSAFGKVMAIMISSLQRQAQRGGRPSAPVQTSAAGTPLGIEVGAAFRADPSADATIPSRAVTPTDYAVRQQALAGTD